MKYDLGQCSRDSGNYLLVFFCGIGEAYPKTLPNIRLHAKVISPK